MKFYAGIGSRQTPPPILEYMREVARALEALGYVLRSGGATGADQAFEAGVSDPRHREILRPIDATAEAMEAASEVHPAWHACNEYAKRLHGRNLQIILGRHLDRPVEFLVCWTAVLDPKGGGTRTGIVAAQEKAIPVYNLCDPHAVRDLGNFITKLKQREAEAKT
jgi:hypothetical protein